MRRDLRYFYASLFIINSDVILSEPFFGERRIPEAVSQKGSQLRETLRDAQGDMLDSGDHFAIDPARSETRSAAMSRRDRHWSPVLHPVSIRARRNALRRGY